MTIARPSKTHKLTCKHKWLLRNATSEGEKICRKCGKKVTVTIYR